jgi:hypothetical protein
MPGYFSSVRTDLGYPDNKHGFVQLEILALEKVELTVVIELISGGFYENFDVLMPNCADIHIHTPGRAKYSPNNPSRAAFLAIMEYSSFVDMEMPLNLPEEYYRLPGCPLNGGFLCVGRRLANQILMNRNADLKYGDQNYALRYEDRRREEYLRILSNDPNFTIPFTSFATIPDLDILSESMYVETRPYLQLFQAAAWFTTSDQVAGSNDYLALPYFPFWSACKQSDDYIFISKLLEYSPECQLVPYENTVYVSQYMWDSLFTPNADKCENTVPPNEVFRLVGTTYIKWFLQPTRGAIFECIFEERVDVPTGNLRWFEKSEGDTLFYLTKEPITPGGYEAKFKTNKDYYRNYSQYWGRGIEVANIRGTFREIPVLVGMGGIKNVIPRQVKFTIAYYQVTQGYKRLVFAVVDYPGEFQCFTLTSGNAEQRNLEAQGYQQCVLDVNGQVASSEYQLEILVYALSWFVLLNLFEFSADVYIIFFTLVGFAYILLGVVVWAINRALTKLRHPPPFHALVLYRINAEPPVTGALLSCVPILIGVLIVQAWMFPLSEGGIVASSDPVNSPSTLCFEDIAGDWTDSLALDLERIEYYRLGRIGTCLFAMGFFITFVSVKLLVPYWTDQRNDDDVNAENKARVELESGEEEEILPPSPTWQPMIWKRSIVIMASFSLEAALSLAMMFSYSEAFQASVYQYIIVIALINVALDQIYENFLKEGLIINAFAIVNDCTVGLMTMGAPTFTDFVLSGIVDLCIGLIFKLYFDPALDSIFTLWPRWVMQFRRKFGNRRRMTREDKAAEELEWRKINEQIELQSEGIEPLLSSYSNYSTEIAAFMLFPFLNIVLLVYYTQTQILPQYGILDNQMVYYIMFAFYILPFQLGFDVFILNTLELVYGWKVYDYVSYQRYRFSVREQRWVLRSDLLDESIEEGLQTLDMLCFSSQYYYMVIFFAFGMMLVIFGIQIWISALYNPFGDPVTCLLMLLIFLGGELFVQISYKLADIKVMRLGWRGLWMTKLIEGTVDDDVAAKLAVGEGRQLDMEQERLELQALNSERFRHRFLERNKPWILQHLVELLTPRSLEAPGPDGRPTIEYVRDVYAELVAMGEGYRRPGDREDISSEEGDELEQARRNWSKKPLTGVSLAIARFWLAKARKRRAFGKLVASIIEDHKKDRCYNCNRARDVPGIRLVAELATDGEPDLHALDDLIAMFEEQYGPNEIDVQLWKAFFRAHAQYVTRCNLCESVAEKMKSTRTMRPPGSERLTRAEDISSDDEDEDIAFEPIVVTRVSPEGQMMSKWLIAARKKLGGKFPRPEANAQMERYAQKLKEMKMKKVKIEVVKDADKLDELKKDLEEKFGKATFNAATAALAIRWVRLARDSLSSKFREKSVQLREDLEKCLNDMPEADDWYYTSALRLEGIELNLRGKDLADERRTLEAEAAVKIRKIEEDCAAFLQDREEAIRADRYKFEVKVAETNEKVAIQLEIRTKELEKTKALKAKEFEAAEKEAKMELGAAPTEMIQNHRMQLGDIDDMIQSERNRIQQQHDEETRLARNMFDKEESIKVGEITRRKKLAAENSERIRNELATRSRQSEAEWQTRSSKWVNISKKKILVKQAEDRNARSKRRG